MKKTTTGIQYEVKWIDNRVYFIVQHPKFKKSVCLRNDGGFVEKKGKKVLSCWVTQLAEHSQKLSGRVYLSIKSEDRATILDALKKQEQIIAGERAEAEIKKKETEKKVAEKVGGYFFCIVHSSGEYSQETFTAKCRKPDFETEKWNPETVSAVVVEKIKEIPWKVYKNTEVCKTQDSRESYSCGYETHLYEVSENEITELTQAVVDAEKKEVEKKEEKKRKKEEKEKAVFDEAKKTGKPVVLFSYTDDCDDPREECSCDQVVIYANPDGTKTTKRWHTY